MRGAIARRRVADHQAHPRSRTVAGRQPSRPAAGRCQPRGARQNRFCAVSRAGGDALGDDRAYRPHRDRPAFCEIAGAKRGCRKPSTASGMNATADWAGMLREATTWILPVIFAVTLHEAAHGFVAHAFGDDTAWRAGRVSLNPLKHVDPFGTVLLPALLIIMRTGFLFGYAKPVPVNFGRLNHPRRDMVFVA